jgi:hypothetical protein
LFSRKSMTYVPEAGTVIYQSKDADAKRYLTTWNGWRRWVTMCPVKASR